MTDKQRRQAKARHNAERARAALTKRLAAQWNGGLATYKCIYDE
jgi:hypothetical protein